MQGERRDPCLLTHTQWSFFYSLYTTDFDPSCGPLDFSTLIQYHISRSNCRRGNFCTYFKCCSPSVVTYGRRWHQELCAGSEESTHHAQTPVASSMETVPGSYLALEHLTFYRTLSHAATLEHCLSIRDSHTTFMGSVLYS